MLSSCAPGSECTSNFFSDIQAFQATGDERFGRAADDIIEYVNRDMRHAAGGYYRWVPWEGSYPKLHREVA